MRRFYDSLDTRLLLDRASGLAFAVMAGLLIGYSLRETAAKLGVPATTLTRLVRKFGKEAA